MTSIGVEIGKGQPCPEGEVERIEVVGEVE